MENAYYLNPINLSDHTKLDNQVEHRRLFNLPDCELNIFETFHQCSNVALSYDGLVVSSMMRGRKVMSFSGSEQFDFLPGESIILPQGVEMKVDFPDAGPSRPVQCATLSINWDVVQKNLNFLNEQYPNNEAPFEWQLNFNRYHFQNNRELAASINRLIVISMENNTAKDALADLSLKFLLLRIIQTQNLSAIQNGMKTNDQRFDRAVEYIKESIAEKITINDLAGISNMSKSVFFKLFKSRFGTSPLDFILQERIQRAKQLLADHSLSITEVSFLTGFNNLNYFIKQFKHLVGVTPGEFRNC